MKHASGNSKHEQNVNIRIYEHISIHASGHFKQKQNWNSLRINTFIHATYSKVIFNDFLLKLPYGLVAREIKTCTSFILVQDFILYKKNNCFCKIFSCRQDKNLYKKKIFYKTLDENY